MLHNSEEIKERIKILQDILKEHTDKCQNPLATFSEIMKIIEKKGPSGILELASYGWYLDFNCRPKTPIELGEKLKNGQEKEVNIFLVNYYEKELDNIEIRITEKNKHRKLIIKEAFDNHRKENYCSSITLMLTQVDGFCYDKAKKVYFKNNPKLSRKKKYKPEIEEILANDTSFLTKLFLVAMSEPTAINEHSGNLDEFPIRLNRHEILHGIDSSYGTKLNSLKIISFLSYINDVLD